MRARLIAFLALVAAAAPGQASRPVGGMLDDDVASKFARMRALMLEGLHREKPSGRGFTDVLAKPRRTIFRGSYDRHSNMAAYWSLLSWARRTQDEPAIRSLTKPFTPSALRGEREFIAAMGGRSDVRPYDDAWLILMLRELERLTEDPEVVTLARKLAAEAEVRVLDFVEGCAPPAVPRPASRAESSPASRASRHRRRSSWLSGAYDSAAWPVLVLQLSPSPNEQTRERVGRLRGECIMAARAVLRETPDQAVNRSFDFLWPEAVFAVSDCLSSHPPAHDHRYSLPAYEPPTHITLANCHAIGCEIVKLWPIALQAGTGDLAARKLFNERLALCLAHEDHWAGPFLTVSHWIPQFVYFAVWLADGRP
jgi:hypothetical protein